MKHSPVKSLFFFLPLGLASSSSELELPPLEEEKSTSLRAATQARAIAFLIFLEALSRLE
jgi:hypothetical protein